MGGMHGCREGHSTSTRAVLACCSCLVKDNLRKGQPTCAPPSLPSGAGWRKVQLIRETLLLGYSPIFLDGDILMFQVPLLACPKRTSVMKRNNQLRKDRCF